MSLGGSAQIETQTEINLLRFGWLLRQLAGYSLVDD